MTTTMTVFAVVVAKLLMLALYLHGRRWRKLYLSAVDIGRELATSLDEVTGESMRTAIERDKARARLAEIAAIKRRVPARKFIATARRIARAVDA